MSTATSGTPREQQSLAGKLGPRAIFGMFPRGSRFAVLAFALGSTTLLGDPPPSPDTRAPTSADAATAQHRLRVATGLRVDAWATEPLVQNITSVAFDERGRAYVVETGGRVLRNRERRRGGRARGGNERVVRLHPGLVATSRGQRHGAGVRRN